MSIDPVFQGMVRPAMILGVPFLFFGLNGMLTVQLFVAANNLLFLLLCVPVHFAGRIMIARDPQIFSILAVKMLKTSWHPNKGFWGAETYRA